MSSMMAEIGEGLEVVDEKVREVGGEVVGDIREEDVGEAGVAYLLELMEETKGSEEEGWVVGWETDEGIGCENVADDDILPVLQLGFVAEIAEEMDALKACLECRDGLLATKEGKEILLLLLQRDVVVGVLDLVYGEAKSAKRGDKVVSLVLLHCLEHKAMDDFLGFLGFFLLQGVGGGGWHLFSCCFRGFAVRFNILIKNSENSRKF